MQMIGRVATIVAAIMSPTEKRQPANREGVLASMDTPELESFLRKFGIMTNCAWRAGIAIAKVVKLETRTTIL